MEFNPRGRARRRVSESVFCRADLWHPQWPLLLCRWDLDRWVHGDPFYMLPIYFDSRLSQDGLGGAFNLRGALRNRIVSDGFILSNMEAKLRLTDFYLLRQYFSANMAFFFDMAYVTQTYQSDLSSVPSLYRSQYFNNQRQILHHTFGPGQSCVMLLSFNWYRMVELLDLQCRLREG